MGSSTSTGLPFGPSSLTRERCRRDLEMGGAWSSGGGSGGLSTSEHLRALGASPELREPTLAASISRWIQTESLDFSAARPPSSYHAAFSDLLHRKLCTLRRNSDSQTQAIHIHGFEVGTDLAALAAAALAAASKARSEARGSAESDDYFKKTDDNSSDGLGLSVVTGITIFFRLMSSLQRSGHVHGLLTLAQELPTLLAELPVRALAPPARALTVVCQASATEHNSMKPFRPPWSIVSADSAPHDDGGVPDETGRVSDGVVDALWTATEELASLDPSMLGADAHAATFGALVALAVKRGNASTLLRTVRLLLFGERFYAPSSQGILSSLPGLSDEAIGQRDPRRLDEIERSELMQPVEGTASVASRMLRIPSEIPRRVIAGY